MTQQNMTIKEARQLSNIYDIDLYVTVFSTKNTLRPYMCGADGVLTNLTHRIRPTTNYGKTCFRTTTLCLVNRYTATTNDYWL